MVSDLLWRTNNANHWVNTVHKHPRMNIGIMNAVLIMLTGNECLELIIDRASS